ncbi:MAG: hypothetical protein ILA34_00405 [Bacteroidaceae bacterium]|nr:hypothetical protein [Bacteroidaceae bacterium]
MRHCMLAALLLCGMAGMEAQNLAGRTYHNANILANELNSKLSELDSKMAAARTKAVTEKEKELGRKLTDAEKAKVDKELKENRAKAESLAKGMKTAVTIEFKTATDMVMKLKMSISDDAMKNAGIGWLKRKALKAAIAAAPSSQKATYTVAGNMVITSDGKDKDTLFISGDGKQLSGILDIDEKGKKTKFTLTRIQ